MNTASQEEFNRIVQMSPEQLTDLDRAFLRARRDYLTDEQAERFDEVLTTAEDPDTTPGERKEKLDRNALMKEAKTLGIPLKTSYTAEQVKGLIDNFKAEQEAAEEEARVKEEQAKKEAEEAAVAAEANRPGHKGNFAGKPEDQPQQ